MNETNVTKDTIVIFSAKKARELLKKGYQIVDIKPDKTDEDKKRSVFVFKFTESIVNDIKSNKEEVKEGEVANEHSN